MFLAEKRIYMIPLAQIMNHKSERDNSLNKMFQFQETRYLSLHLLPWCIWVTL